MVTETVASRERALRSIQIPGKLLASRRRATIDPVLRAYLLGLLSVTVPRSLSLLLAAFSGRITFLDATRRVNSILYRQLAVNKFPATCAILVAGVKSIPELIRIYLPLSRKRDVSLRFISSFFAALLSFTLMNSTVKIVEKQQAPGTPQSRTRRRASSSVSLAGNQSSARLYDDPNAAGRTLDFTFFAFVRALDVLVNALWRRRKTYPRSAPSSRMGRSDALLTTFAAPTVFALSSGIVMWNWFYYPDNLPRSYNSWISSAAQIDGRLIEALRECRKGSFIYGKDTGWAPLLGSMCADLKMPRVWGDPSKTIPIPCELYHSGAGPNCEKHALWRFGKAWRFAFRMYLPLNILMLFRRTTAKRSVVRALAEASRSSAFLASFVSLFYYGVCLARKRLRNTIFRSVDATAMDGGICTAAGCAACGWSIFIEHPGRRPEFAFFVAPRALATFFPRRYERKHIWFEQTVFAVSVATVLTAVQTDPKLVHGVFGGLLASVLR